MAKFLGPPVALVACDVWPCDRVTVWPCYQLFVWVRAATMFWFTELPETAIWARPEINGAEPMRREPVRYIPVTLCPRGYVTGRRAGVCNRCLRGGM